jgi:hypothetical protein
MPLLSFELLKSHNWVFPLAGFIDYIEKKKFVFLCFFPPGDSVFITTKMVGNELLTSVVPYIDRKTIVQICQMRSLWPPPPSWPSFIAFVRKEWRWCNLKIVLDVFCGWRQKTLIQFYGWTARGVMSQGNRRSCFFVFLFLVCLVALQVIMEGS